MTDKKKRTFGQIAKEYGIKREFEQEDRPQHKLKDLVGQEIEITGSHIFANEYGSNSVILFCNIDGDKAMAITGSNVIIDIIQSIPAEAYPFWAIPETKVAEDSGREYLTFEMD